MRGPGRSRIRAASHTVGIVARLRLVAGGTGAGFGIGQGQMRLPGVDRVEFELGDLRCLGTVAQRFAQRLGMSEAVQHALLSVFEQWDGSGPSGRRGDAIPVTSRVWSHWPVKFWTNSCERGSASIRVICAERFFRRSPRSARRDSSSSGIVDHRK